MQGCDMKSKNWTESIVVVIILMSLFYGKIKEK